MVIGSRMFKFTLGNMNRTTKETQFVMTEFDKHSMEKLCAYNAIHLSQDNMLQFKCMEKEFCLCVRL